MSTKLTKGWCVVDTGADCEPVRGPFHHKETAMYVLAEMELRATGAEVLRLARYGVQWVGDRMPPKRKPFRRPTVEEVAEYCAGRRNGIDAETFVRHYEAKGWMIGKTKMRNWKSAIITWEKRREAETNGSKPAAEDQVARRDFDNFVHGRRS